MNQNITVNDFEKFIQEENLLPTKKVISYSFIKNYRILGTETYKNYRQKWDLLQSLMTDYYMYLLKHFPLKFEDNIDAFQFKVKSIIQRTTPETIYKDFKELNKEFELFCSYSKVKGLSDSLKGRIKTIAVKLNNQYKSLNVVKIIDTIFLKVFEILKETMHIQGFRTDFIVDKNLEELVAHTVNKVIVSNSEKTKAEKIDVEEIDKIKHLYKFLVSHKKELEKINVNFGFKDTTNLLIRYPNKNLSIVINPLEINLYKNDMLFKKYEVNNPLTIRSIFLSNQYNNSLNYFNLNNNEKVLFSEAIAKGLNRKSKV